MKIEFETLNLPSRYQLHQSRGIVAQFPLLSASLTVSKLAALAQALITIGLVNSSELVSNLSNLSKSPEYTSLP
jgi:hypothetical protein